METEKLYYQDPYQTTFTARVLTCEPSKGGCLVTLDRTAFYPEGGGQPADHGVLGGVTVTDVHEKDGVIFHACDKVVEPGSTVEGSIDWTRRFDHMQQHSGEHILSGLLCSLYDCSNVGFHLGADTVTIDYDRELTWEQVLEAERQANEAIWRDTPAEITFPAPDALAQLDYRSKKELTGQVRIVSFPGADCCACCGTHVRRAGEVGLIKVLSCQKFREGVRLEILCGQRAYRYLSRIYEQDHAVARLLSVKPQDAFAAVERQNAELTAAKLRMTELEDRLFALRAQSLAGRGDVLLLEPPMRPDGARKLADTAARAAGGLAAVFAGERDSYVYALVHAGGADISPLVKRLNSALSGRGGGRNGFAQGSVQADRSAIPDFFHKEGIECSTC
ncbi:alanine--tRNA ligase-related protein [uncultured Oscillibacter sp.]|uniref:alanyl-tRNA editing protein n=1 Tax=uncultured Oscillibacter sp. TaxID=876091 RepID=UPI001F8D1A34|nr:alanine--tRNA ligase-related protein [uncultured Oscillibacter sp.]HJB75918.1 alanyl-tRNA editing protein [Candidatus Oscillibacter avistercoris]